MKKKDEMMSTKNTTWDEVVQVVSEIQDNLGKKTGKDVNGLIAGLQDYFCGSPSEKNVLAANYLLYPDFFWKYYCIAYSEENWDGYLETLFPDKLTIKAFSAQIDDHQKEAKNLINELNALKQNHKDYIESKKKAFKELETVYEEKQNQFGDLIMKYEKLEKDFVELKQKSIVKSHKIIELKAQLFDMIQERDKK